MKCHIEYSKRDEKIIMDIDALVLFPFIHFDLGNKNKLLSYTKIKKDGTRIIKNYQKEPI